jgi:hypothetical protein
MNFTEIGRKAKAQTRDYDDLSDYEAGRAYALTHLRDDLHLIEEDPAALIPYSEVTIDKVSGFPTALPPSPPSIPIKTDSHFFLEWRASHMGNQIAFINAQYAKDHAIRLAEFDHSVHSERTLQRYYLEKAQYALSMLTTRQMAQDALLAQQVGQEAAKVGLDRITYLAFRLKQIDSDLRGQQLLQDQQNKEEMDRIQRQHEFEDAMNRVRVDTEAAMADRQMEKQLRKDLTEARERKHSIENGDKPPELKKHLVADCDDEINGLVERIRVLQEIHRQSNSG